MLSPSLTEFRDRARNGGLIPVFREILADCDTPVSALLRIREGGGPAFLMESVEGGERVARHSFLGTDPSAVFSVRGDDVTRFDPATGETETIGTKDPLGVLRSALSVGGAAQTPGLPPFRGGLVGYLAYDMARRFERLPDDVEDDLEIPDAVFLQADTVLAFDRVRNVIQIIVNVRVGSGEGSGNGDLEAAYAGAAGRIEEIAARLRRPLPAGAAPRRAVGEPFPEPVSGVDRDGYLEMARRSREYVAAGDVIQVVPSQRFQVPMTVPPFDFYRALRVVNPSPYMYYLDTGSFVIAGASPETMTRTVDGVVETRPIAGTRPRGRTPEQDRALAEELLADEKERAEHVMLVDLARNDVGRVAEFGSVEVSDFMTVERYSHVMHIVSAVRGTLRPGLDAFDALRATFPAGTLTGAPKIRAMEIIEELETTRRGVYGGAVGYFSYGGASDTAIAIRTLVAKNGTGYFQAGGGIVADSRPEFEYQESRDKARAVLAALRAAHDGLGASFR